MKDNLPTVITHKTKLQSFLGVHQIEQEVHQCQQYVEGLEDDERAREVEIKMKQNNEIEMIVANLESLESLEGIVVKKENILNRESNLSKESKVRSQKQSYINKMKMNIEEQIKLDIIAGICETICLMDGRVIQGEGIGKVDLLTVDGKFIKTLPIPDEAWSTTQINQDTIALTFPQKKVISSSSI